MVLDGAVCTSVGSHTSFRSPPASRLPYRAEFPGRSPRRDSVGLPLGLVGSAMSLCLSHIPLHRNINDISCASHGHDSFSLGRLRLPLICVDRDAQLQGPVRVPGFRLRNSSKMDPFRTERRFPRSCAPSHQHEPLCHL